MSNIFILFKNLLKNTFNQLIEFVRETDFSGPVMVCFALITPIAIGFKLDLLEYFIPITLGAFLASPSDVNGSIRLKLTGILLSSILAMFVTLIGGYLNSNLWFFLPMLGILMFAISYLSIFGFRASLISFSGLFALVVSSSKFGGLDLPAHIISLLIGVGGLWYICIAILSHLFFKKTPIEKTLAKAFRLTAKFIEIRGKLVNQENNRVELSKKLFEVQVELSNEHEILRELLILNRRGFGTSNYQDRKLLVFIELIEMLELAIASPIDYEKTDKLFSQHTEQMFTFQKLIFEMSKQLNQISKQLSSPLKIKGNKRLDKRLKTIENLINDFEKITNNPFDSDLLMLKNLFKYQKHQVSKIKKIKWLLQNKNQKELNKLRKKELINFVTQPDYNVNLLIENFNFDSSIFRHSLRIAVVTIVGYIIGYIFDLQNSYWILLTLVVIMRPAYGLTKTRSQERTIGTLIGSAIAIVIILLINNVVVYALLAVISFILSLAMIQKNYKSAATFITLNVVFIYTLFVPDIFSVIQFRIIDTVIATALAIVGNILLWPAWEMKSFEFTLLESIKANKEYLKEVAKYYNTVNGEPSEAYKLSRKKAFLAMSDLSASFQRMAQEPKTQQKNLEKIYEIAMLNNTFLVATASLGTYTMNNPTTPASSNFNKIIKYIQQNLSIAESLIVNQSIEFKATDSSEILESTYGNDFKEIVQLDLLDDKVEKSLKIEEAHFVYELLKWMMSLTNKNIRLLSKTELK